MDKYPYGQEENCIFNFGVSCAMKFCYLSNNCTRNVYLFVTLIATSYCIVIFVAIFPQFLQNQLFWVTESLNMKMIFVINCDDVTTKCKVCRLAPISELCCWHQFFAIDTLGLGYSPLSHIFVRCVVLPWQLGCETRHRSLPPQTIMADARAFSIHWVREILCTGAMGSPLLGSLQ